MGEIFLLPHSPIYHLLTMQITLFVTHSLPLIMFFPNRGFTLISAQSRLLNYFCHGGILQKYFPRSQIEMSFISLVNIWDNVSGSTPLPPHKTYKCLRNFPAGLYTHARWHLFKTSFAKIAPRN